MKDPVFGNLEYEYGWNGTVEFNCFGRMEEIALTVSGEEDDPITEYQHNSFRAFMETWEQIMSDTAEAIKKYYLGLRQELGYDQECNADYPPLDHTESILEMISLDMMVIPEDGIFDGRCVCLAFSCSWDEENGLGIRFVNEEIDEIGYQDVAF